MTRLTALQRRQATERERAPYRFLKVPGANVVENCPNGQRASPATSSAPLPVHPYRDFNLLEWEVDPSGTRAWLAREGTVTLREFHGPDARRLARDWIGTKFGVSPAAEIDVPLGDEVPQYRDEELM